MNTYIELLELVAELLMSDDKSRKALGAEIKRLTESWINNWSPDFCNDDEWGETKQKVDAILEARGGA
jgi:hypothetical protein